MADCSARDPSVVSPQNNHHQQQQNSCVEIGRTPREGYAARRMHKNGETNDAIQEATQHSLLSLQSMSSSSASASVPMTTTYAFRQCFRCPPITSCEQTTHLPDLLRVANAACGLRKDVDRFVSEICCYAVVQNMPQDGGKEEDNGEIVAAVWIGTILWKNGRRSEDILYQMYTQPKHRRQGLMNKLLRTAVSAWKASAYKANVLVAYMVKESDATTLAACMRNGFVRDSALWYQYSATEHYTRIVPLLCEAPRPCSVM